MKFKNAQQAAAGSSAEMEEEEDGKSVAQGGAAARGATKGSAAASKDVVKKEKQEEVEEDDDDSDDDDDEDFDAGADSDEESEGYDAIEAMDADAMEDDGYHAIYLCLVYSVRPDVSLSLCLPGPLSICAYIWASSSSVSASMAPIVSSLRESSSFDQKEMAELSQRFRRRRVGSGGEYQRTHEYTSRESNFIDCFDDVIV
jgi:hypothetical protein